MDFLYTFSLVELGGFFYVCQKVPRATTQQEMGRKILFYKRVGLLFLLKCSITLYSCTPSPPPPSPTPGNTSSKREHERRIFHPCISFLAFTAGLINRIVSDGGRVCLESLRGLWWRQTTELQQAEGKIVLMFTRSKWFVKFFVYGPFPSYSFYFSVPSRLLFFSNGHWLN